MGKPTLKHALYVERGYEDCPEVLLAFGQLVARYGKDNVQLVIEDPPYDPDEDADAHDLAGRRSIPDPT